MVRPASRIPYPPALQEALAWLGAPPAEDALHDLAPARKHLAAVADVGVPPLQHVKILELFEARIRPAGAAVKPLLLDATLPVPKRLRIVAQGLMQVHRAIAAGYLKALREATPHRLKSRTPSRVCAAALTNLRHEYEIAQFVAATPGPDFWATAEALYGIATASDDGDPPSDAAAVQAVERMKALLALAAGQPEGFSPRELAFLADYLDRHAGAVDVATATEGDDDYWLDAVHGFAPTAAARRRATDSALHFRCAGLSRLAREHIARLSRGEPPEAFGVSAAALPGDCRDVLERAAAHWENPRLRRTSRRRHGYRVQLCAHLGRLWQYSGGTQNPESEPDTSEWMVLNESASGYSVMHVAGTPTGLIAGSAVGLRPGAGKPWSICIVRWARSDNPEHIELGLELVAPQADAVRVTWKSKEDAALPALLLPSLPALGRGESLLAARGSFVPGSFALIKESSGRIQVAECAASQLQMHTACIEIFEFERLRQPG